jgi:hypothetical protein
MKFSTFVSEEETVDDRDSQTLETEFSVIVADRLQ